MPCCIRQWIYLGKCIDQMVNTSRHIVFLINPVSGGKAKEKLIQSIEQSAQAAGVRHEVLPTDVDGNYHALKEKIQRERITDIVICGGDGSISAVVGALREEPVRFGIIPAGSGNGLARAARIPLNSSEALNVIMHPHTLSVDGFLVNDRFSCMLTGLGFDAHVAHQFAQKKRRGFWTYLTETIRHYFNASSYRFKIQLQHTHQDVQAYFISIANSNQFGNDVTIAPCALLNDGKLDIVVVNNMNKIRLLWEILHQIRAGKVQSAVKERIRRNIYYVQTSSLHITNPEMAPLHIDGDPVETSEHIYIQIIQNAFQLLVPQKSLSQ